MKIGCFCWLLATAIPIFAPSASPAITLGQVDTFEDGTRAGWLATISSAFVRTGGPQGSDDHCLLILSGQSGANDMEMNNQSQWIGNFISAGVTGIEADLKVPIFISPSLHMRLVVTEVANISISAPAGYVSGAFDLPNDGEWHHAVFPLTSANMTAIDTTVPLSNVLSNILNFKLLSSVLPSTRGDHVPGGVLYIDNIRAVPEPSTICLAISGAIGLILFRPAG